METPLLSVLVPIYNVEKYLRECLESLKNQSFLNLEIICINDGSTDSSRDIIEEYLQSDSRFKVIDKPNSGYGSSMNMGLDCCSGEYIGILESDDFLNLDAYEKMYEAAKKYDAQVVKSDFFLFWSEPQIVDIRFNWVDKVLAGHINPQIERDVFFRKPSIWSAIYKRSFLENNNIRFLETPGASYQDAGFNFKVWASCDNAVLLDEAFLHYRQDNEASSVNSPGKVFCVCDEYSEMHEYLNTHWIDRSYLRGILARMRFDTYEWNYDRLNDELKERFFPKMLEDITRDEDLGYFDPREFDSNKLAARRVLLNRPELYPVFHASQGKGGVISRTKYIAKSEGLFTALKLLPYSLK